ncbi:phage protease [Lutispora thermophila]|nr:phage protease [Lutispora thermophila]
MSNKVLMISNSIDLKGVPNEIKILPLGLVKSQKGDFYVDKSSYNLISQNFISRKIDLVIDYEHQTLKDVQAPAGGWIKSLILKNDGIYAKVEWTPKAIEYLRNKEYRYLSPVVLVNKGNKKAVALHSVALTNTPAIDGMEAIINSLDNNIKGAENMDISGKEENKKTVEQSANIQDELQAIIKELGLKPDSELQEILEAIQALKNSKTESEIIVNKLKAEKIRNESDELVQIALSIGQISEEQKEWAVSRCMEDIDGFRMFVNGAYQKERDNLISLALKTGKILPFQKTWAEQLADKDISILKTFVNQAKPVIQYGELEYFKDEIPRGKEANASSPISEILGLSDEDIRKYSR